VARPPRLAASPAGRRGPERADDAGRRRGRRQRRVGPGDPGRRAVGSVAVRPGLMSPRRPTMPRTLQGIVGVLGRVLLCTIFLLSAVGNKVPNFRAVAGSMAKEG